MRRWRRKRGNKEKVPEAKEEEEKREGRDEVDNERVT